MKIKIADRTLCKEGNTFSFKEKIEISRQLEKLNVNTIELPEIVDNRADTLLIRTIASFVKNSVISVAGGLTKESVEQALSAIQSANKPRIRIEVPVSTVGMEYTCHKKAPKMLEITKELITFAKSKCNEVEFCALDATRAEKGILTDFIKNAVELGVKIITICDSAAEMMPNKFGNFIGELKSLLDGTDVELSVSCNNINGLACANAVASIENGTSVIKTDVTGANIPLETMCQIFKNCGNSCGFSSDIKYEELLRIIKQINWIIGNAKNDKAAVTVAEVDENGIKLDSTDNQKTVSTAVGKLGYDLSQEDLAKVYEEFLRVAAKKNVGAKELEAIVASVALQVPPTYKLKSYVINNGNIISASAQITLEKDGETMQGICIGDGPIAASFLAIEQIIGHHYELDDFQIHSVTEGKEAMGNALVKLRQNGKLYSGTGISTDIMGASIRAYINAVNKIVYEEAN